jgi:hypothetical protein
MKKLLVLALVFALMGATALVLLACGKRTETETKTTVIEREVTTPAPATEPSDGHLQRAGEKIDAKVDRKIDEAIDKAIGE